MTVTDYPGKIAQGGAQAWSLPADRGKGSGGGAAAMQLPLSAQALVLKDPPGGVDNPGVEVHVGACFELVESLFVAQLRCVLRRQTGPGIGDGQGCGSPAESSRLPRPPGTRPCPSPLLPVIENNLHQLHSVASP